MLTIKDLSASKELDRAAMTAVTGGFGPESIVVHNYPYFDLSHDLVVQDQIAVLDQSGNWGGSNLGAIYQNQNGNA